MSSLLGQTEDALLAAIQAALPDIVVDSLPGTWEEVLDKAFRGSVAVWVVYTDTAYAPNAACGVIDQRADVAFQILVVSRSLRSPQRGARGAYEAIESICNAVAGIETPLGGIELRRVAFVAAHEGRFVYSVQVVCQSQFRKE